MTNDKIFVVESSAAAVAVVTPSASDSDYASPSDPLTTRHPQASVPLDLPPGTL